MNTCSSSAENSRKKIIIGIILLAIGSLFLSRNLGVNIPEWLTSWPMILIIIGIASGIKHRFTKAGAYITILIGMVFLTDRLMPGFQLHELVFPLVITSLGIALIVRRNYPFSHRHCRTKP